ncbi:hypothetical protein VTG60DRAFT_714 [Thermothelomyces hinnuleus]
MSSLGESLDASNEALGGRLEASIAATQDKPTVPPSLPPRAKWDRDSQSSASQSDDSDVSQGTSLEHKSKENRELIRFLKSFEPPIRYTNSELNDKEVSFVPPYHDLFFAYDKLRSALAESVGPLHRALTGLVDFTQKHFGETFTERNRCLESGTITFPLL